jgi:hypothetical protein
VPDKKPYHRPRLEEYGDIREVTRSVDMAGAVDGGHGSMSRTG